MEYLVDEKEAQLSYYAGFSHVESYVLYLLIINKWKFVFTDHREVRFGNPVFILLTPSCPAIPLLLSGAGRIGGPLISCYGGHLVGSCSRRRLIISKN